MTTGARRRNRFGGARSQPKQVKKRPEQVSLRMLFAPVISNIVGFRRSLEKSGITPDRFRAGVKSLLEEARTEAIAAGYEEEMVEHARFSIVAFADESVVVSDWPHKDEWTRNPLQQEEFGTTMAGNQFFERLESQASMDPELAELDYIILSLGFAGQYAGMESELEGVRRKLFKQFPAEALKVFDQLTPEAYEENIEGLKGGEAGSGMWKWVTVGALALVVILTYAVLQWRMGSTMEEYRDAVTSARPGD